MRLSKIPPFSWLIAVWNWLAACVTRTEIHERVVFYENGKVLYYGPRAGMPPEYEQRYRKAEAEMRRMEIEMEKVMEGFL